MPGIDHESVDLRFTQFVPWRERLALEPWSPAGRVERLGLSEKATKADSVTMSQNDNPALIISHGSAFD